MYNTVYVLGIHDVYCDIAKACVPLDCNKYVIVASHIITKIIHVYENEFYIRLIVFYTCRHHIVLIKCILFWQMSNT